GRRGRPRAGVHRGDAGLEARARAPTRRADRPHRARRQEGGAVELALLRRGGPRLVLERPLPDEVRQSGFLPRHVAGPSPARRVEAEGRALPRHPRGRPLRRRPLRVVGQAGLGAARRGLLLAAARRATPKTERTAPVEGSAARTPVAARATPPASAERRASA